MAKKKDVTPASVKAAEDDVAEAAQEVAQSKEMLTEAQQRHEAAVQAHADLVAGPPPVYGKHLVIEGQSGFEDMPAEWGGYYQFRLMRNGNIYDHCGETAAVKDPDSDGMLPGVWVYRKS